MTHRWATVVGLGFVCASAILAGALELMLVPLYSGSALVPVTVLFAIAGNIVLPLLGRSLAATTGAALAPFAAWLLVVVVIGLFPRSEGDVILPGGGSVQWVGYGVVLGGVAAGVATVAMVSGRPPRAPAAPGAPESQP